MKKIILVCLCLALTSIAYSQTIDKKWNIGLHAGAVQYHGDLGNGYFNTAVFYASGGLSVSRYLGRVLDLNLMLTKGELGYASSLGHFRSGLSTATLNLRFNILKPESFVRPYLFLGGGALMFEYNPTDDGSKIDYAAPSFGAGINFALGSSVMFQIQEMILLSTNDNKDGMVSGPNDFFFLHTVGLTFNFGKKHDEDLDGIADRDDKCPGTPSGIAVDKKGCPLDRDVDGVADYQDDCPDVAGLATFNGCPDKDGDGITDKERFLEL